MKVNYEIILEEYNLEEENIKIALEAGEGDPVTQEIKNASKSKPTSDTTSNNIVDDKKVKGTLLDKLKNLLAAIKNMIGNWITKLKNRMSLFMTSTKGYTNGLKKQMKMVKPVNSLKLITYSYSIALLDSVFKRIDVGYNKIMNNIMKEIEAIGSNTPSQYDDKEVNKGDAVQELIQLGFKNNELDTPAKFFNFLREKFRGEKQERVYTKQQLPAIIQLAGEYESINTKCSKCITEAGNLLRKTKVIESRATYKMTDKTKINKCVKLLGSANKLRNFYNSFIKFYLELKIEQVLNYRTIVRKFYQF